MRWLALLPVLASAALPARADPGYDIIGLALRAPAAVIEEELLAIADSAGSMLIEKTRLPRWPGGPEHDHQFRAATAHDLIEVTLAPPVGDGIALAISRSTNYVGQHRSQSRAELEERLRAKYGRPVDRVVLTDQEGARQVTVLHWVRPPTGRQPDPIDALRCTVTLAVKPLPFAAADRYPLQMRLGPYKPDCGTAAIARIESGPGPGESGQQTVARLTVAVQDHELGVALLAAQESWNRRHHQSEPSDDPTR